MCQLEHPEAHNIPDNAEHLCPKSLKGLIVMNSITAYPAFQRFLAIGAIAAVFGVAPKAEAILLVGNTEGNNIVSFDEQSGAFTGEFIPILEGLESPDDLTFGPDGNLYISYVSSQDQLSGAILKFDGKTGAPLGRFDQGGSLKRPYGITFGPDHNLYVSSFRSDEILRYNASTGAFIDIFAKGTGTANGLNGPNDLLFDNQGNLYVTTQGSVADGQGGINYQFDSQVLRYSLSAPNQPTVFAQPTPSPDSLGFVSLLGLALGPQGDLFVSDFANDIRRYDRSTGQLLDTLSTNYTGTVPSNNFVGNLAFDANQTLYTVGFDFTQKNQGAILRFDGETGDPLPALGQSGAVLVPPNANLKRPIGIAYKPAEAVPEPSTILASLAGFGMVASWVRSRRSQRSKQV